LFNQFANAIISKLFAFDFVNTFSSFFYIAFVAMRIPNADAEEGHMGECGAATCMTPLAVNLGIIFIVMATWGNITETVIPFLLNVLEEEMAEMKQSVVKPQTYFRCCLRWVCCARKPRVDVISCGDGDGDEDEDESSSPVRAGAGTIQQGSQIHPATEAPLGASEVSAAKAEGCHARVALSAALEDGLETHLDSLYLDHYDVIEDLVADYTERFVYVVYCTVHTVITPCPLSHCLLSTVHTTNRLRDTSHLSLPVPLSLLLQYDRVRL
jgi:hypothetical protein